MKTNLLLLTMLAGALTFAGCDKGCTGDPDAPPVSAQAQSALLTKYPTASNVRPANWASPCIRPMESVRP